MPQNNTFNPLTEDREWHPAVDVKGCQIIESRLQRMGLRIEVTEVQDTGDQVLSKACIYEGPDADPHANRWQSHNETDKEWES